MKFNSFGDLDRQLECQDEKRPLLRAEEFQFFDDWKSPLGTGAPERGRSDEPDLWCVHGTSPWLISFRFFLC